jgi:hypothetical protein
MRSIKPGRGPSAMGAIGSVVVGLFGIFWTIGASSMGAPPIFTLFGIVFVGLAIMQGLFHLKNATGKNRMSMFDITDSRSEPDPLNRVFGHEHQHGSLNEDQIMSYCPYCGNRITNDSHSYCSNCGKELMS